MVLLGDIFPDFEAESTMGIIKFHDYIKDSWAILFSHPRDFTPVCTTELAEFNRNHGEFEKRGVKVLGFSLDSFERHKEWEIDILAIAGGMEKMQYPILVGTAQIAKMLGMLDPEEKDEISGMPFTARSVFFIGPDLKLKALILYPATSGRNFTEIIRILDSLQLTYKHKIVATPVNWKKDEDVIVDPKCSTQDAQEALKTTVKVVDVPSKKEYIRYVTCPK